MKTITILFLIFAFLHPIIKLSSQVDSNIVVNLYLEGIELVENHHFEKGLENGKLILTKYLRSDFDKILGYRLLAHSCFGLNKDSAVFYFERLLKMEEYRENDLFLKDRQVYQILLGKLLFYQDKNDEALTYLKAGIKSICETNTDTIDLIFGYKYNAYTFISSILLISGNGLKIESECIELLNSNDCRLIFYQSQVFYDIALYHYSLYLDSFKEDNPNFTPILPSKLIAFSEKLIEYSSINMVNRIIGYDASRLFHMVGVAKRLLSMNKGINKIKKYTLLNSSLQYHFRSSSWESLDSLNVYSTYVDLASIPYTEFNKMEKQINYRFEANNIYPRSQLYRKGYFKNIPTNYYFIATQYDNLAKIKLRDSTIQNGLKLIHKAKNSNLKFSQKELQELKETEDRLLKFINPIKYITLKNLNIDHIEYRECVDIQKNLGEIFSDQGLIEDSNKHYLNALNCSSNIQNKNAYDSLTYHYLLRSLATNSSALESINLVKKAINWIPKQKVEGTSGVVSSNEIRFNCYNSIVSSLFAISNYFDAKEYIDSMYVNLSEELDNSYYINYYLNIADYYTISNREIAAEYLSKIENILEQNKIFKKRFFQQYKTIKSLYYQLDNQVEKALQEEIESLNYYKKTGFESTFSELSSYFRIAFCYGRLKKYNLSLNYIEKSLHLLDQEMSNYHQSYISFNREKSLLLSTIGKKQEALNLNQRIISFIQNSNMPSQYQGEYIKLLIHCFLIVLKNDLEVNRVVYYYNELQNIDSLMSFNSIFSVEINVFILKYYTGLIEYFYLNNYNYDDAVLINNKNSLKVIRLIKDVVENDYLLKIYSSPILHFINEFFDYDFKTNHSQTSEGIIQNFINLADLLYSKSIQNDEIKSIYRQSLLIASKFSMLNRRYSKAQEYLEKIFTINAVYDEIVDPKASILLAQVYFHQGKSKKSYNQITSKLNYFYRFGQNTEPSKNILRFYIEYALTHPNFDGIDAELLLKYLVNFESFNHTQIRKKRTSTITFLSEKKYPESYINYYLNSEKFIAKEYDQNFQYNLGEYTAILYFFKAESIIVEDAQYLGVIISQNKCKLINLGNAEIIDQLIQKTYSKNIQIRYDSLNNIFYKIIEDVSKNSYKNLIIIAEGNIQNINFGILKSGEEYLIDKYCIRYVQKLNSMLLPINELPISTKKIVLFGNPQFGKSDNSDQTFAAISYQTSSRAIDNYGNWISLPETQNEIDVINNTFKSTNFNIIKLERDSASESNLMKIDNPEILHIATHGFYDNTKTAYNSGIVMSGANNRLVVDYSNSNDGYVYSEDIERLNLSTTKLVVLSSCESGISGHKNDFRNAFFSSGTSNILVSLWQIDDVATKKIMEKFYTFLSQTNKIKYSFDLASKYLREEYPNDISKWGGFILIEGYPNQNLNLY